MLLTAFVLILVGLVWFGLVRSGLVWSGLFFVWWHPLEARQLQHAESMTTAISTRFTRVSFPPVDLPPLLDETKHC